jgi:hypothetical protein
VQQRWEIWRRFNAVHDLLRDEASLELTIHIKRYDEAYRQMWNNDRQAGKVREIGNRQLERYFCERAFEKEFLTWSVKMANWELKMQLRMSPWAIIPARPVSCGNVQDMAGINVRRCLPIWCDPLKLKFVSMANR